MHARMLHAEHAVCAPNGGRVREGWREGLQRARAHARLTVPRGSHECRTQRTGRRTGGSSLQPAARSVRTMRTMRTCGAEALRRARDVT